MKVLRRILVRLFGEPCDISAWPSSYCLSDGRGREREQDWQAAVRRNGVDKTAEALGFRRTLEEGE